MEISKELLCVILYSLLVLKAIPICALRKLHLQFPAVILEIQRLLIAGINFIFF